MQPSTHTQRMVMAAVFATLTAVGAFIRIPLPPVPFSLQIMFAIWSGLLLGPRLGLASQAVYIIIGLVGVPVFATGGGLGYLLNPTFGYLLGFAAGACVAGMVRDRLCGGAVDFGRLFIAALTGLVVAYAIGVPYMYLTLNRVSGVTMTLKAAVIDGCLIFLPWDVAKMALAAWLAATIIRRYPRIGDLSRSRSGNVTHVTAAIKP